MNCERCGARAESNLCFRCKGRKAIPKKTTWNPCRSNEVREHYEESNLQMKEFFLSIWRNRSHISEVSEAFLGHEPLSVFFHHILSKKKYDVAKFDPDNVILVNLDEHSSVELDMHKYEEVNKRREQLYIKYKIHM